MKQLIWSLLALLPVGALAQDVYVSVDADGQVIYSDRPTGSADETVIRMASNSSRSESAPAAAAPAEPERSPFANQTLTAEMAPSPAEQAETRASNCEIATERAASYSTAQRLYTETPEGERVYLTAEEIDEIRATAEADVAEWCD